MNKFLMPPIPAKRIALRGVAYVVCGLAPIVLAAPSSSLGESLPSSPSETFSVKVATTEWAHADSVQSLAQAITGAINEQAKLAPSDGRPGDFFGYSVSLSGDRALVGAYGSSKLAGTAYIFAFDGTDWVQEAKLLPSDRARNDEFGISVSLSGDRALIGAYNADNSTGAAYIFTFDGVTWNEQAKLTASDGVTGDFFGYSVALAGSRVLVGAPDSGSDNRGAAYLFVFNGTSWEQEAKLSASDAGSGDFFGNAVSLSGQRALVGAWAHDGYRGAVYAFKNGGGTWSQEAELLPSDRQAGADFGFSVSLSGERALIGSYNDDVNGRASGSAYIFALDGSNWSQQAKLIPSDGAAFDQFGVSVSLSGKRALVGASEFVSGGAGAAYLFVLNGTTWSEHLKLTSSDGIAGDSFGISVSVLGRRALVGSHRAVVNGARSGAAYLFGP